MSILSRSIASDEGKEAWMRGDAVETDAMFSYISPAARVPKDHPLRSVRQMVDKALHELSPRFEKLYSRTGRPSIPPERLLRALLLQMLYSIRSERMLMEQLDYNLLFRWFVGLSMDDPIWDATTFSKNRERLLEGDIAVLFFEQVMAQGRDRGLLSDEHFTVDGTLLEAWASQKSFKRKDSDGAPPPDPKNPTVDFRGEKRTNDTHASTTDPQARLYRKGPGHESKLSYMGHAVMENRNGLAVGGCVTQATGYAEREAALQLVQDIPRQNRATLAADKAYDVGSFVAELRDHGITPHIAQNDTNRSSAIDGRTTRHPGYEVSQKKRKRVEEIFGWIKTVGMLGKLRHRGLERVGWVFTFALAAYNLVRMRNLEAVAA
jgi:transposase